MNTDDYIITIDVEEYDYEEEYKGYCICTDMRDGSCVAFDDNEEIVEREGTVKFLKRMIDDRENRNKE